MRETDPTLPRFGTDPIQVWLLTFEARLRGYKMNRRAFSFLIVLFAATQVHAQDVSRFNPASVPADGMKLSDFVPRGWKIGADAKGDLNGDGRSDHVLQLVPDDYDTSGINAAPETQALLVLVSSDGGRLHSTALTSKLLVTIVPQYILNISIKNGVLVVNQNYGMTDVADLTHRFRYESNSGRFLLIGKDTFSYHRPQGPDWPATRVSENYLTGVRLTTTEKWMKNGTNREIPRREKIARSRIFLEDVDEVSTQ
jgi:hypothetical protein